MQELNRISHRIEKRQLMDELVKHRVPAVGQKQRHDGEHRPKQNHSPLGRRVNVCAFLQREKQRPSGEQHDDDSGVFARPGVALQELVFVLNQTHQLCRLLDGNVQRPGQLTGDDVALAERGDDFLHLGNAIEHRVLPHRAPVVSAVERTKLVAVVRTRGVETVAVKTGDDDAQRLHFRQAPLCEKCPLPLLCRGALRGRLWITASTLKLGVNKGGHRLRGGQSGDKRDKRDAGKPASCRLAKRNRFFRLKPLYDKSKQHECCDVEAEQRTDIVALHQAKPDTDAG